MLRHSFNTSRLAPAFAAVLVFVIGSRLTAAETTPASRVYRDHVDAHWFANNTRFWYRNDLSNDHREYILVDANAGTRAAAFDTERIAETLRKVTNEKLVANHLPIESLRFNEDASSVVLQIRGKAWQFDLKTYAATPAPVLEANPKTLTPTFDVHPSRRSGAETHITFENNSGVAVDLFWIDEKGKRKHYAELKPGEKWNTQTYDGHVWIAVDKNNKTINVFEASRESSTAVITKNVPLATDAPKPVLERKKRFAHRGPKSPDGKWTASIKEDQLVVKNSESGIESILSNDGKAEDNYSKDRIWWSPDSTKLIAMREEPAQEHPVTIVESSPKDQIQPKLRTANYLKPGDRIAHLRPQLFNLTTLKHIPVKEDLFPNPWSIDDAGWSNESTQFTFMYNERGHQALRLISIDAITGIAKAIIDEKSNTFICYSGKYYCKWIGEQEIVWMSERDGWNHLWLIDAQTGAIKSQITHGEWVVQKVTNFDEAKRCIEFNAGGIRPGQDPYYTHCCRVNLDGTGLVVLTEGDGTHTIKSSPDNTFFFDTYSRIDLAQITELRRTDTGKLICKLEEADASEFFPTRGKRWPERFVAKGRDGKTDIYGIILYPNNFDPTKKYPVVENIYAGPQGFFTPKAFRTQYGHQQKIADAGAIVIQCDGMGTSGRSKAFHDVCFKNLRDAGFLDRIVWIKDAAKSRPQMDLSRVGIYGGSAGGQNAMAALLWHNDFYKVAVADCGCHDNRMDKIWWNEQWMGYPDGKQYEESSNAVNAHLLEGKLLLIVGEMDSNVDPASTMQVIGALEKANKDFEFLPIIGANHGAAETPYGTRRRLEFLVRNLNMK